MSYTAVTEFGAALIKTKDLDPVYVALDKCGLEYSNLARILVSYWSYYHLGVASWMSESRNNKEFWERMTVAAINKDNAKRYPRGAERRHFRGDQSILAVKELKDRYDSPERIVEQWCDHSTFQGVSDAVQQARGFGPWIAFKIADMSERVLGYSVDFTDCHLGVYKDPRQGAALVRFGDWQHPITNKELVETIDELTDTLRKNKFKAPPRSDRLVNVQETESILCKFKSYTKGHYYVGKDIHEVSEGLRNWGSIAQELLAHMPKAVQHG